MSLISGFYGYDEWLNNACVARLVPLDLHREACVARFVP